MNRGLVKTKKPAFEKAGRKGLETRKKVKTVKNKCVPSRNAEAESTNGIEVDAKLKKKQTIDPINSGKKEISLKVNLPVKKIKKNKQNTNKKDKISEKQTKTKSALKKSSKDMKNTKTKNKLSKVKKNKQTKLDESDDEKEILTKKQLEGLKSIDPEFYKFLKENDKKLLEFDMEDSDLEEDESNIDKENSNQKQQQKQSNDDEKFHKPSANDLEVPSDESDFEGSGDDGDNDDNEETCTSPKITLHLLREWEMQLQQEKVSIDVIRMAIKAFNSALASISTDETGNSAYTVIGAPVFNGVIQLCVLHLHSAILKYLGLNSKSKILLHKTKKWTKLRSCLRCYLMDLIRLIDHISSTNILSVLLKHLHQVANMMSSFSTICKPILKKLIALWSTSDETIRILAFLCILKITRNQQESMLNHVLKSMYLSYVRNSKFVNPNTLPSINFMRRSLVEMFALDLNITYQHSFMYIRQLAIHLRNAVILKKKDSFQSVYNWQYINSIRLWTELLGATINKSQLQPLVYPLITIIIGVIKLIPTAQYFPLRFHCIQSLIMLAKETNTFIPVLPLILEVFKSNTFNKKHTIVSMKSMPFTCILRLNKTQLSENGFRDEVIENVCGLMLEYLSHESSSFAYPDLIVPTVINLKQYLKQCKNVNYSRKLKILLDKIQENSIFIENERCKINFGMKDIALVRSWEHQVKNKNTPLDVFYNNWIKTHETKKRRLATDTEKISDYDLPMIKRKKIDNKKEIVGEVELFPSDSENDEPEEKPEEQKKERKKKKTKVLPTSAELLESAPMEEESEKAIDCVDIVEELDLDDW